MSSLTVTSPSFANGGQIPLLHTGFGADCSPQLELSCLSSQAVSLAVVLCDMDHPIPAYPHWLIWDLPAAPVIPGNIPPGAALPALGGAVQGVAYGKNRYRGPKPPFHWSHRYHFTVYALDCRLSLPPTTRRRQLLAAMQGHILQQGQLAGHYR